MSNPSVLPVYRQLTRPGLIFSVVMMGLIVMLAVGWGATELELLILGLDEVVGVGVEVGVESCQRINYPGCHIEGAHWSDA